jgi:hypothetical protein
MKSLLLLRKLFLTTFILMLVACNTSASDTKTSETSQSENVESENIETVQVPEEENWRIFEDRRNGVTFAHPSDWKVIIEEEIIVLEGSGSFGHVIFHDLRVPADELHVMAEDMFDRDNNYVEVSRTQYSNPDRYMSVGSFKDGRENIVRFLVAYPEYGLIHWEMISDQDSFSIGQTILENIIFSVRFANVQNQDTVGVTDSGSEIETSGVKDDILVSDSSLTGKATWNTSSLDVLKEHPEIACLNDTFNVFVDVFGVYIVATSEAPMNYVVHTANVLAQYIDNDADGIPDDLAVLEHLVDNKFVIPVWSSGDFFDDSDREKFFEKIRGTDCEDNVRMAASMYYDDDEWALGGIQSAGTWDTNLEEVWHVVSIGWYESYPDYFGDRESVSSMLTDAMDEARGGRFLSTPERYPENAWYTYDDETCDYGCMVHEYFYWILMANLDALDPALTDKCRRSEDEWSVCNRDQLAQIDPLAHSLLNDYDFKLPTIIPDGTYVPSTTYTNSAAVEESLSETNDNTPILNSGVAESEHNMPTYKETICIRTDIESHNIQMTEALIDCLIETNRTEYAPVVLSGESMDQSVVRQVEEALDYGVELLGSWGPVYNVLVGINDPDSFVLAEQICSVYHLNGLDWFGHEPPGEPTLEGCIENIGTTFSNYDCCGAAHNPPAPLHPVGLQSVLYSGAEVSAAEGRLRTTVLHEYVHVFQNAQTVWPNELDSDENGRIRVYNHGMVWLEEGSAEFFAQYFAGQKGWADYRANMKENLLSARDVRSSWGLSLRDVETRDGQAKVRELCDCGGQLYYETGTWAAAWLVNRSSADEFLFDYFPRLSYDGWEATFRDIFGLTMDEFYDEFDAFLDQPIEQQMAILP